MFSNGKYLFLQLVYNVSIVDEQHLFIILLFIVFIKIIIHGWIGIW